MLMGGSPFPPHTRGCTVSKQIRRADLEFPPHTRGCTGVFNRYRRSICVSPAHAGMYLDSDPCYRGCIGFPRTRGDVPITPRGELRNPKFPPHTRGCTAPREVTLDSLFVSPAHAGMYRLESPFRFTSCCFPRTRGDVPHDDGRRQVMLSFPPHTRGCTLRGSTHPRGDPVSPAHAGMYPYHAFSYYTNRGFPRTRGDVPSEYSAPGLKTGFPPHTRGCTRRYRQK